MPFLHLFFLFLGIFFLCFPYIFTFFLSFFQKKHEFTLYSGSPLVSIIIPACNEEKNIKTKIENTLSLKYENKEIIVVSDGSTDGTNDILKSYSEKIKTIILKNRTGKPIAINTGISSASGEFIILTDSTVILNPETIEKMLSPFSDEDISIVFGRIIFEKYFYSSMTQGELSYWEYENYIRKIQSNFGFTPSVIGGLCCFKKSFFIPIPENVVADDLFLLFSLCRNNMKSYYIDLPLGIEKNLKSTQGEFHRKIRVISGGWSFLFNYSFRFMNIKKMILFFSCKLSRWIAPFFFYAHLITLFIVKNSLSAKYIIYSYLIIFLLIVFEAMFRFIFQAIFSYKDIKIRWLSYPFYFIMTILAGILGFLKFLFHPQSVKWRLGER